MAELLTSGGFDRHVRRVRIAYRRRRDRLVSALAGRVPAVSVSGIAAGMHALVHLPPGGDEATATERAVIERAAIHGLAVEGLGAYTAPGHERDPALVVGYGTPPEHAYTTALARLVAALEANR
jgi:GntR family transcriptional regulator/MocR family aminotransferase